jgi:glycosyltransferase involved in cell wall biosynthesis
MGTGLAVVTAPTAVCDHFYADETAIVCDTPTAESFADAIERLLADRGLAQRIATAAMEHVRRHHAASGMAELTAATYRQLALARATFPITE